MNEGHIKFNCRWIRGEPLPAKMLENLNAWRQKLRALGLLGMFDNGIGFGNLSIRHPDQGFIISGSATGGLAKLNEQHYALVKDYDLEQNSLLCFGPIKASSESLSHAVIYEASPHIGAVIHVHSLKAWKALIDRLPTTSGKASYGTPAMAREIQRLFHQSAFEQENILIMGGHPEGIIAFGNNLHEAGEGLIRKLRSII